MEQLDTLGKTVKDAFQSKKRVLSFAEYLELVQQNPRRHARSAAQFALDMFDHFGTEVVRHPTGEIRRFRLFDTPWDPGEKRLVGEEEVQNAIYRILANFVRQGRVDRFILLHGSNGSSKSTISELVAAGLEYYSALDEGALYCFNWIFPTQKAGRGGIGFGGRGSDTDTTETFAYLEDEAVDARLICELHDHPLLLLPRPQREEILDQFLEQSGASESALPEYLTRGELCHKCKLVYEALLNSYQGDYLRVLRHVQVERFFISRRYRKAAARVEPQLAVDAKARQVTMDRSLSALPTALQSINLFELDGDLVQANRGLIDSQDLLKRPVEAYKYLLTTVEDGRVVLEQTNLFFDMMFLGSSNDTYLNAFMESPEWMSFKARMELVRVPYLLDYTTERWIYDDQIGEGEVGKHIAPLTTTAAALWAVLTRMHRPEPRRYEGELGGLVEKLAPLEKARLYGEGKLPREVKGEAAKLLRAGAREVFHETAAEVVYEGRTGASPREVKTAILNAAQNTSFECLTPQAVFEELRRLVKETSVYAWLRQEASGGYFEHASFIDTVEEWYVDQVDDVVRQAMGLVEEASYQDLFSRYIIHVTHFVRNEKLRSAITGGMEDPDPTLMGEVEKVLGVKGDHENFRQGIMTKIGAWSVDHAGEKPDYPVIFPEYFEQLSSSYYEQQRQRVVRILRDALSVLAGEEGSLSQDRVKPAQGMLDRLEAEKGYCRHCAREAISLLVRKRYSD
jgi:predicted Ser/Thr protein kinase